MHSVLLASTAAALFGVFAGVNAQSDAATTTIPVISGDGPRPPSLTATASTGSWTPVAPTSGPGAGLGAGSLSGQGRQAYINDANDFCIFMPPDPTTQNLVDAEAVAVAYCFDPFNNTRPMPDGFIKTAHYRKTANYHQISGTYDASVMNLNPSDCGGEYDNHGAEGVGNPVGAQVTGGDNWNQFIGGCDIPGYGTFCLRSCFGDQSYPYCNNRYDLMGCLFTMPGDYEVDGFTSCEANSDLPIGVYNSTYTFMQGQSATPTPVTAPASSNCRTLSSPTASGVTYTWNQLAASSPTATGSNGSKSGSSSSKGSSPSSSGSGNSHSGALGLGLDGVFVPMLGLGLAAIVGGGAVVL